MSGSLLVENVESVEFLRLYARGAGRLYAPRWRGEVPRKRPSRLHRRRSFEVYLEDVFHFHCRIPVFPVVQNPVVPERDQDDSRRIFRCFQSDLVERCSHAMYDRVFGRTVHDILGAAEFLRSQ